MVVHRGTNNVLDVVEDYLGVLRNKCTRQKTEAFLVVDLIVQKIKISRNGYSLSFTGHSLGAFLAELSVYFSTVMLDYCNVHAVTFESPGSLQSMKSICWHPSQLISQKNETDETFDEKDDTDGKNSKISTSLQMISLSTSCHSLQSLSPADFSHVIKRLDIISYVCYPNIINICNEHVGTLYAINICMDGHKIGWPHRLFSSHSIQGIVEWFQKFTAGNQRCVRLYMADWPKKYTESQMFFKYVQFQDGMLSVENLLLDENHDTRLRWSKSLKKSRSLVVESSIKMEKWVNKQRKKFKLKLNGNFDPVHGSANALPLHHFSQPLQNFLNYFYQKRQHIFTLSHASQRDKLHTFLSETWKGFQMPPNVSDELLNFTLKQNKLHIMEIVCKETNVHDFRSKISCWLEMTGFTVEELLNENLINENMPRLQVTKHIQ